MDKKQEISQETLQKFYDSITDVIYEYLINNSIDKKSLPMIEIVKAIRNSSICFVKELMDIVIAAAKKQEERNE